MVARKTRWAIAAVWALCSVSLATAESIDDVIKKIDAKGTALTSAQTKTTFTQRTETADMKMSSKGTNTIVWQKKDGKLCYRMEGEFHSTNSMGGNDTKTDMKSLVVCDGEFMYTYNEVGDQKSATKSRPTGPMVPFVSTQATFDEQRKDFDLKLLPDASVGGHPCWVIEATPKKPAEGIPASTTAYYCQETGCLLKSESKDSDGKVTGTMVSEIKTPAEVTADTFKFTAPAGVEVQDATAAGGETPPPAETPKADDQPANEKRVPVPTRRKASVEHASPFAGAQNAERPVAVG